MAIQLEPVELDISDALNDIDTLKKHIEDAFSKHSASEDPRIVKLLQQMRNVYDTLGDVQQRMGDMHFDPSIESTLTNIRNGINGVQTALQQARENVTSLEQSFQNMNFDPNLDDRMQTLNWVINNTNKSIEESKSKITQIQPTQEQIQEWNRLQFEIERTVNYLDRAKGLQSKALDRAREQGINWENPEGYTKIYLNITEDIKRTQEGLNELLAKEKELEKQGFSVIDSKTIQEEESKIQSLTEKLNGLEQQKANVQKQISARDSMSEQIEQAKQSVQSYETELKNLQQTEKEVQQQQTAQNKLSSDFQKAADSAAVLEQRLNQVTDSNNRASRSSNNLKSTFDSIKKAVTNVLSHVKSFAKSVTSHIKSVFSSLLGHVKSIAKSIGHSLSGKFGSLGKSASNLTGGLEKGFHKAFRVLLKYGLGVRSLFFLFRKLRAAATESLGEMAKQIPEVNKQMSSLKQSMNQMKGSLGTMIQPLLNILVPVLTKIAALVTSLTEKIASFFALLTGQSYIVSATAGAVDYAESLDKTGKSAKKAKKELQGYLSPIDEINKYQEKNKDDEDDGSGVGGGGITYKKKGISDDMKKFFEWLKDMWKKADFTDLGRWLGEKLLKALQSIPWDEIKRQAYRLGKSLATLIGGLITIPGLGLEIGKTLAEAINTAFMFLNGFVHHLPWKALGTFIADFFNGVFETIDWHIIRDTWVTGLKGISDAINQFIEDFHWDNISKTISNFVNIITEGAITFLTNTDFATLGTKLGIQLRKSIEEIKWDDIGRTLGLMLKDMFDFAVSFLQQQSWESIKTALHDILMGFLEGLGLSDEQVDGIMGWVGKVEAVFEDLLSVLSDIWKAIQPLVTDIVKHIIDFVADLPDKLNSIRESEGFQNFLNWLSSLTWDDIKNGITGVAKAIGILGGAFVAFKGLKVVQQVTGALSGLLGLFKGGGAVASAAGGAAAGGGVLSAAGTILAVIGVISAIILAAGGLKQIPGFEWLVKEGIDMLKTLFMGLGEVLGAALSGIGVGLTVGLPEMAENLSEFGQKIQPFLSSMKQLDKGILSSVGTLTGILIALTTADIMDACTSWLTGGNSIIKFGQELIIFGACIVKFADIVKGIDSKAVESAANAGKTLAEMANALPMDAGPLVDFFAGDNDMKTFGEKLVPFGEMLMKFADSVKGLNGKVVENAANAGKAVAEMASALPMDAGPFVDFFAGDNDMKVFGEKLAPFGKALMDFANATTGLKLSTVSVAATAGKMVAEMAKELPMDAGPLLDFFAGDNDIKVFGQKLPIFGKGLKDFADATNGLKLSVVETAATAGKIVANMAKEMPMDAGPLLDFLVGDNDIKVFGQKLEIFGECLMNFATSVEGLKLSSVETAATAGKILASMAKEMPTDAGPLIDFLYGDNDIKVFGQKLEIFGECLMNFATSVDGLNTDAVEKAATAGRTLASMAKEMPTDAGPLVDFLFGDNDIKVFGKKLVIFGESLMEFATAVDGLKVSAVETAANAGMMLANMAKEMPIDAGPLVDFLFGDNDIKVFGKKLVIFGECLMDFAQTVDGLNTSAVSTAANAGKMLADLAKEMPHDAGPLMDFLFGDNDMKTFGKKLVAFGESLVEFSNSVRGINLSDIPTVVNGAMQLVDLAKTLNATDTSSLKNFGANARVFAQNFGTVGADYVTNFLAQFIGSVDKVNAAMTTFLGYLLQAITVTMPKFIMSGSEIVGSVIKGMETRKTDAQKAAEGIATAIKNGFSSINEGLTKSFEGAISSLKKIWNNFGEWMNKRLNIEIDTSATFGKEIAESLGTKKLNIGRIPRLAQGAVIPPNREFMAVLGDQNKGTNIETPLATMVDAFNQALAMNGGNGQSITLNLMLPDRKTVAQYAIEGGQVLQMSRGYNPFLLERG